MTATVEREGPRPFLPNPMSSAARLQSSDQTLKIAREGPHGSATEHGLNVVDRAGQVMSGSRPTRVPANRPLTANAPRASHSLHNCLRSGRNSRLTWVAQGGREP